MKLNVGCGRNYRKGYINIDAFDNTVADRVMAVESLDFEDNSFTQVDCIHVLEHLGAARSIYALAEIYRVLRPNGVLHIQTPDLVSSFKSFIKGDTEKRKLLMNWIYGLDSPGMSHRYGFPEELIHLMLREAGFEEIEIGHTNVKSESPTLQASCRRTNSTIHHSISHFRKRLVNEKAISLEQQVDVLEVETLIQELLSILHGSGEAIKTDELSRMGVAAARCCPRVGQVFLETLIESELCAAIEAQKHVKVLQQLDALGFPGILVHLFMEMPILPGRQRETFQTTESMVGTIVEKMLRGDKNVQEGLVRTNEQAKDWNEITYFSEYMLEFLSGQKLALGLKAFAADQWKEACDLFLDSIRLNRDSVLAYWNIARVYALRKETSRSLLCYKNLKELVMNQYLKQSRKWLNRIDREIKSVNQGECSLVSEPVHSMP